MPAGTSENSQEGKKFAAAHSVNSERLVERQLSFKMARQLEVVGISRLAHPVSREDI